MSLKLSVSRPRMMSNKSFDTLDLVLSTGATLTLRHVFPPMMLGVDVHSGAAMSFNWSAHTDSQHHVAASRRVLCAGGLEP